MFRTVGRRAVLVLLAASTLAVGAACGTSDNPETELPCEFFEAQRESGVDVTIPEECQAPGTTAPETPDAPGAPGY